jgi:hypothetical protein
VELAAYAASYERQHGDPVYRPLKIYTIDPSSRRLEGATAVINVPYETLNPGPIGARFEVIARGEPFGTYAPVDLDDKRVLIRSGRDPAPTDPAFHHQMVYAVCSSVYAAFRTALGRELAWGFGEPRLRLYPHAERIPNASYSREEKSLKFGWFQASEEVAGRLLPQGYIFTSLSHDIIAHELTHALLDGLRAKFEHPVSGDVEAFHEAFADLIALFQRFTYKEVVKNAIRRTGADLSRADVLLQIAIEFAQGLSGENALRKVDLSDEPKQYCPYCEPHELGSVLLSAIFEAFVTVYKRKSAPYIRMATQGTGLLQPSAELPADLLEMLSHLASRLAGQFLSICIRAVDYCPPVNLDFGEYLRAIITADADLVPDDPWAYREALIEAFGRRRIYPDGVKSLTEDALLWEAPLKTFKIRKLDFGSLRFSGDPGSPASDRELRRQACVLGAFVTQADRLAHFGLVAKDDPLLKGDRVGLPTIESIRSSRRVGPDGQTVFDLVAEITQCRTVRGGGGHPDFDFYGGSTVILGPKGEIRYVIRKKITDKEQIERQRDYMLRRSAQLYSMAEDRPETKPKWVCGNTRARSMLTRHFKGFGEATRS